jgi:hypothetical protein
MAQLTLQDIIRMMGADNQQLTAMNPMNAALAGASIEGIPRPPVDMNEMYKKRLEAYRQNMGNVSDMEMQKLVQAMAVNPAQAMRASPVLSLPANEMQRNYADGQAPIAIGGGLLADEAQMLMNTAYDMSAPREMRINAINRLRKLGY